jgi:hypothetical protein
MSLEFEEALKALDERIEILKHNLLFLTAQHKIQRGLVDTNSSQKVISLKRELDKCVQERMKLSQIYHGDKDASPVDAISAASA